MKGRLSYYMRLARNGETVFICERNRPMMKLVPVEQAVDRHLRESALGFFKGAIDRKQLDEAIRPMTDAEADAFIDKQV